MIRLAQYTIIGAVASALIAYLLSGALPEGAVAGLVLGGSLGLLVAVQRGAGDAAPVFDYEAAGIHDDNLTTSARRNLVRDAYRQTYERSPRAGIERRLGSARGRLLADAEPQSDLLAEQIQRLEYRQQGQGQSPLERAQTHDLQLPPAVEKRKRKPKRKRFG